MVRSFLLNNLLFVHGHAIIIGIIFVVSIGLFLKKPLLYLGALLFFAFSLFTFRYPHRTCPGARTNPLAIICPADGTVISSEACTRPGFTRVISLFISPFDAHVMWIPFSGTIEKISYTSGSFMPAFFTQSSLYNESNEITINSTQGALIVRQVAGFFFRRICCWVNLHDTVIAGNTYGMIRFGSRVDIFLPAHTKPSVAVGQQVTGGQTILAYWVTPKNLH